MSNRLHLVAFGAIALSLPLHAQEAPSEGELQTPQFGYDGGFYLRSADGGNELVLEGLFQTLWRYNGTRRSPQTEAELKRMRPELAGTFDEHYHFRLEPKFSADEVELEEAWVGAEVFGGDGLLMIGRMKAPFNLEEVRSRRYIPFPFFSIMNQFAPAEQHGAFLNGNEGRYEYGFALYNGGGGDEGDEGKEAAARLMWHPFRGDFSTTFEALQLGVAGTYGEEDRSLAGRSIENAAGLSLMDFAGGVRQDGTQWRLGLEAAWYDGPYMLQAEWMHVEEDLSLGGSGTSVGYDGGYLAYQQVLTGATDISFKGVAPKRSYDPYSNSGPGALALALRASLLESDSALRDNGLLLPGGYTERVTSLWAGLNWYLSTHALLRTSYVHSFYSDDVMLEGRASGDEGALLMEFQLHF